MSEEKDKRPEGERLAEAGLRQCMATKAGRAFLWAHLSTCGIFRISAGLLDQSPSPTFFREGERNTGNRLLNLIQETDIDAFLLMQREAFARGKGNDGRRERKRAAEFGQPAEQRLDGDASGE